MSRIEKVAVESWDAELREMAQADAATPLEQVIEEGVARRDRHGIGRDFSLNRESLLFELRASKLEHVRGSG